MSEFTEIKIKVKLTDNGKAVINNEDGICTEIEEGNDFYRILPLIKRKLANDLKPKDSGSNIPCVTNPVKIMKPIRATYFKTIDELNEWIGDGANCEIISLNYDSAETVHWAYYRLK